MVKPPHPYDRMALDPLQNGNSLFFVAEQKIKEWHLRKAIHTSDSQAITRVVEVSRPGPVSEGTGGTSPFQRVKIPLAKRRKPPPRKFTK